MKLNLGCGTDIRSDYINIDIKELPGVNLVRDVSDFSYIKDNSVEEIIARDIIEHFPKHIAEKALREWHRILKPYKKIYMTCPDIKRICERYLGIKQPKLDADFVSYLLYGDEKAQHHGDYHKAIWDAQTIRKLLERTGFKYISIDNDQGANLVINCYKGKNMLTGELAKLHGERKLEITWLLEHILPGSVLDIGAAESVYLSTLIDKDHHVTLNDIRKIVNPFPADKTDLIVGDIRIIKTNKKFKNILLISTLEHIGLEAPIYGTKLEKNPIQEQINALKKSAEFLDDNGQILITFPFGNFINGGWWLMYNQEMVHNLIKQSELDIISLQFFSLVDEENDIYEERPHEQCSKKGMGHYKGIMRSHSIACMALGHP